MAFNQQMLEDIGAWCLHDQELAQERQVARRLFFGDDDPRPVQYWTSLGGEVSRERRFLGWFMFDYALSGGQKAAEIAVEHLYTGGSRTDAWQAVAGARFVLAVVTSLLGRSVFLELENETFEVQSRVWAAQMEKDMAIAAHILPVRYGQWLPGPGWFSWPARFGPGLRANLKNIQLDPIASERFLQGRIDKATDDRPPIKPGPRDSTLGEAVARMEGWVKAKGYPKLVMSIEEWLALVLKHIDSLDANGYIQEVVERAGAWKSQEDLQEMLPLAINIWNNTPQPDRGGRTANQILER